MVGGRWKPHGAVTCCSMLSGSSRLTLWRPGPGGTAQLVFGAIGACTAALARRRIGQVKGWDLRPVGQCALYALSSKSSRSCSSRPGGRLRTPSRHRDRASAVLASLGRVLCSPMAHWSALGGVCMPSRGRGSSGSPSHNGIRPSCLYLVRVSGHGLSDRRQRRGQSRPRWSVRLSTVTHAYGFISSPAGIIGSNHRSRLEQIALIEQLPLLARGADEVRTWRRVLGGEMEPRTRHIGDCRGACPHDCPTPAPCSSP